MEDVKIDIGDFVEELVESWEQDQLLEYCKDNLYDFYRKHKETLKKDYKLFMEDKEAHHVQGY